MIKQRISLIGGGKMGEALIKGILEAKIVNHEQITVSDMIPERLDYLKSTYGVKTTTSNIEATSTAEIVILAVKPQVMSKVLSELGNIRGENILWISIAAGVTVETICSGLGKEPRVIRVMPNTPAQVRAGVIAIAAGEHVLPEDIGLAENIFGAVGEVFLVNEALMDAVTGVSGSGPAYVCLLVEGLASGGVRAGLPVDMAYRIATQTFLGTAKMILETNKHPAQLRDEVTSPGGTTIAGLSVLEKKGIRGLLIETVEAATNRAKEMGKA